MNKPIFLLLVTSFILTSSCKKRQKVTYYSKSYYTMKTTPFGKANFFTESRSVTAIRITSKAVWVGTNKGLLQFDHDFRVKQIMTKNEGLPSNSIRALAWQNDTLYAGTDNGLALFSHGAWQNQDLPLKGKVTVIEATPKGGLWVGMDSGLLFHAFGRFAVYKKGIYVTTLKLVKEGVVAGTATTGLMHCFQGNCTEKKTGLSSITALERHGSALWVAGRTKTGASKLKLFVGKKQYSYSFDDPVDWLQSFKDSIMFYSGGSVFNLVPCAMRAAKGFTLKKSGSAPCYFANINATKFPPKMTVVTQARNFLWVGTGSLGVARFDGTQVFYFSSSDLVSRHARALSLGCAPNGKKCWFAAGKNSFEYTDKGGFKKLPPLKFGGWYFTRFLTDPKGNTIGIAKNDKGDLTFFRMEATGKWKPMVEGMVHKTGDPSIYVNFSYFTKDYIAWLGVGSKNKATGIFVFNFSKNRIYHPKNYRSTKGEPMKVPVSTKKMSIRFGHRYLATDKGVVHLWKMGSKKYITIKGETDGLNSDTINDVVLDKRGVLWAGTDLGLCQRLKSGWRCGEDSILPETGPIVAFAYDDTKDALFIASKSEIYLVSGGKKQRTMSALGNLMDKEIRDMRLDSGGRLWILHPEGLSVLYPYGLPQSLKE